ncbi:MAG: bifunctional folylpolyglutamate synthase/dihydrofolate synthase [Melioribacteraceae bacterium]|nr:bifunctional folylpolyglutamate synthase/dihydrofolate synthase [Melioribacteraceae bacterium]
MNIEQSLNKLFSLHQFGIKLGLENITRLLDYIGHPHEKLFTFHIAGSNGKGSTASFMASMLQEAGFKTGLYTSPHFVSFNERIRINGIMIPDEYICEFMNYLNDYIDLNKPTFFELTTAMAFKYFSENKIDYAVIETGLGGRLDATNVLNPIASLITSISLEHTNILGNNLIDIAREKAGIIKRDSQVFVGDVTDEVGNFFKSYASVMDVPVKLLNECTERDENEVSVMQGDEIIHIYSTPLAGYHQKLNSALAIVALLTSLKGISAEPLLRGIDNVIVNTGISGRYEIYNDSPRVVFDSCHNPDGADKFIEQFKLEKSKYNKSILVFGAMRDKDIESILPKLSPLFDDIFAAGIDYERAFSIEDLITIGNRLNIGIKPVEDTAGFICKHINEANNDCLVVLGSMYLLGSVKKDLVNKLS